ncbi:hypothetical protein B9479_007027 [Cryptococcus floricola]|uniref:COQ9 domain-containing protein n=1 Tax=Cryptococcus floricola TaxID=2591691 RepID=A0A5D3AQB5_9TREE|nr:hypothetical protein B9479_007027 [Cryptococcus floricola]
MSLRAQILAKALSAIPSQSFTRPALVGSLVALKPEFPDPEAVIDTVFGPGNVVPAKALVEAWEEEGLKSMRGTGEGQGRKGLEALLARRLEYSAGVGEHLVEAYANMATPDKTHTFPLPLNAVRTILSSLQTSMPPLYSPGPKQTSPKPQPINPSFPTLEDESPLSRLSSTTPLPIPLLNPIPPLMHSLRIASEAIYHTTDAHATTLAKKGVVKRGYWNEPVGPGPEWYGERLGLGIVYLVAESHLLQPLPSPTTSGNQVNPHLPAALASLRTNLVRYQKLAKAMENTEENVGDAMGFVDYVARSWQGLIKSRYW